MASESRLLAPAQLHVGHRRSRVRRARGKDVPIKELRYQIIDSFLSYGRFKLENMVKSDKPYPATRSFAILRRRRQPLHVQFWAIPEEIMRPCCRRFISSAVSITRPRGYRTNMLCVGYRVLKDSSRFFRIRGPAT